MRHVLQGWPFKNYVVIMRQRGLGESVMFNQEMTFEE